MNKIITCKELDAFEKRYRVNLLTKLSGFKSAGLIGSIDTDGQTNLGMFSSISHIGASPFYIGFILRPTTVERHTYENIKQTYDYTINLVNEQMYEQAHQTSAKYDRSVSEFGACDLHEEYLDGIKSPFVRESTVKLGLSFVEEQLFKCNQTRMIIGKVEKIVLPDDSVDPDGNIRLDHLGIVSVNGLDSYYKAYFLKTLEYARP